MANIYLEAAERLFAKARFSEALPNLIRAYKEGPDNEVALSRIYSNYVKPYEGTFRKSFSANCENIQIQNYEDCEIDFIPISDGCGVVRYILFDKKCKQFVGELDIAACLECQRAPKCVSGLLIADCWDLRELMPVLKEKQWPEVYFVLNGVKSKFMSFFKLAELRQMLPERIHVFETAEELRTYFLENCSAYLPRKIVAPESGQYEEILKQIHDTRIQSGVSSDNVLLSVCIPSYNRGGRALEAVKCALHSEFDVELEIIVSNNGSSIGKEDYQQIKSISDSRVRYYEFQENKGVAANIYNCLEKSRGRYAILFSDEDTLAIEFLGNALDYLGSLCGVGACVFNAAESFAANEFSQFYHAEMFKAGENAVLRSFRANYITGVCFNMEYLRELPAFKNTSLVCENMYYIIYPHCSFAALLAKKYDVANTGIALWNCGVPEKTGGLQIDEYCSVIDQRLEQESGLMRLTQEVLSEEDCWGVFKNRINATFGMLSSTFYLYKNFSWIDVCKKHYENCMGILQECEFEKTEKLRLEIDKIFLDWLDCRRIKKWLSPKENLKSMLRAQTARHCYNQGTAFVEIDFDKIDAGLDRFIGELL